MFFFFYTAIFLLIWFWFKLNVALATLCYCGRYISDVIARPVEDCSLFVLQTWTSPQITYLVEEVCGNIAVSRSGFSVFSAIRKFKASTSSFASFASSSSSPAKFNYQTEVLWSDRSQFKKNTSQKYKEKVVRLENFSFQNSFSILVTYLRWSKLEYPGCLRSLAACFHLQLKLKFLWERVHADPSRDHWTFRLSH